MTGRALTRRSIVASRRLSHSLRKVACRLTFHRWGSSRTGADGQVDRSCAMCGKHVVGRASRPRPDTDAGTRNLRFNAEGDSARY